MALSSSEIADDGDSDVGVGGPYAALQEVGVVMTLDGLYPFSNGSDPRGVTGLGTSAGMSWGLGDRSSPDVLVDNPLERLRQRNVRPILISSFLILYLLSWNLKADFREPTSTPGFEISKPVLRTLWFHRVALT